MKIIKFQFQSPVTALTWGHNDKRLFVATGPQVTCTINIFLKIKIFWSLDLLYKIHFYFCVIQVHIGWISKKIPSLQLMCRLKIHKTLQDQTQVDFLPIPYRLKNLISSLFTNSIKARYSFFFFIWNFISIKFEYKRREDCSSRFGEKQ